jgi:hypothetical protein
MSTGTFKPNHAGFQAIAVGPEVAAVVTAIATKGLAIAEGLAADFIKTGDYAEGFEVRTEISELKTGFGSHPVVVGVLENTSGHAAAVEWGNKHDNKAHHVLGRTLDGLASA